MALLIAHRGASHLAPENTLAAFRLAQNLGAHGFEMDLQRCASGELVIFHDRQLLRTTNYRELRGKKARAKSIARLTLKELREFDAGSWKDARYSGEKIPTFEEFLEMTNPEELLDIEIKTFRVRNIGLEEAVLKALNKYRLKKRNAVVSSFNPIFLRRFRQMTKDYPIGLISERRHKPNRSRKFWIPVLKPEYLCFEGHPQIARDIDRYKKKNRKVLLWTLDTPEEFRCALDAGADGIITNRPEIVADLPKDLAKQFRPE